MSQLLQIIEGAKLAGDALNGIGQGVAMLMDKYRDLKATADPAELAKIEKEEKIILAVAKLEPAAQLAFIQNGGPDKLLDNIHSEQEADTLEKARTRAETRDLAARFLLGPLFGQLVSQRVPLMRATQEEAAPEQNPQAVADNPAAFLVYTLGEAQARQLLGPNMPPEVMEDAIRRAERQMQGDRDIEALLGSQPHDQDTIAMLRAGRDYSPLTRFLVNCDENQVTFLLVDFIKEKVDRGGAYTGGLEDLADDRLPERLEQMCTEYFDLRATLTLVKGLQEDHEVRISALNTAETGHKSLKHIEEQANLLEKNIIQEVKSLFPEQEVGFTLSDYFQKTVRTEVATTIREHCESEGVKFNTIKM